MWTIQHLNDVCTNVCTLTKTKNLNLLKINGLRFLNWGFCRIRTGVDGFADHCLATRPTDLLKNCFEFEAVANIIICNYNVKIINSKLLWKLNLCLVFAILPNSNISKGAKSRNICQTKQKTTSIVYMAV